MPAFIKAPQNIPLKHSPLLLGDDSRGGRKGVAPTPSTDSSTWKFLKATT